MTLGYYPRCTCGVAQWTTAPVPCPMHGYYVQTFPATSFTWSIYRACQGRHCAHDVKCNKGYLINGGGI
jgi:hypothetical protein